jgi:uncharacterized protein with FMN-binding domain
MRRVLPAIVVTLAALALLANFHTAASPKHPLVFAPLTTTTPTSGGTPPPSGTGRSSPTTSGGSATGTQQVDGQVIPTQYGNVQVRVVLVDGKITDVQPLQLPFEHRRSQEISQLAAPTLHDEALGAQSAQINLVSGATYTSAAYQESLQSALAQART